MEKKKIKVDETKGLFGVDLKKLASKPKTTKKTVKRPKRK